MTEQSSVAEPADIDRIISSLKHILVHDLNNVGLQIEDIEPDASLEQDLKIDFVALIRADRRHRIALRIFLSGRGLGNGFFRQSQSPSRRHCEASRGQELMQRRVAHSSPPTATDDRGRRA